MALSRKHYREVADMFKAEREFWVDKLPEAAYVANATTFILANKLATMFQHDNSNFDRDKFLEACGIE